jgi:hypothetical protein
VQQHPCRLIASDSKHPLQPQSTDPILLAWRCHIARNQSVKGRWLS